LSGREADVEDVAVGDDVVLGFVAHQVVGLDLALASQAVRVVAAYPFGPDEAAGQVGVDVAGGFDDRPQALESLAGAERADPNVLSDVPPNLHVDWVSVAESFSARKVSLAGLMRMLAR